MTDDRSPGQYLGIGAAAAAVVLICGAVGYGVDAGLGTVPIFLFVGLLIGIVGAVAFVYTKFRDSLRDPQQR